MKTAALLMALAGLALVGLVDRDRRIAGGDLAARAFGYVVRIDLTVERDPRPTRLTPGEWGAGSATLPSLCTILADSLPRVAVWR